MWRDSLARKNHLFETLPWFAHADPALSQENLCDAAAWKLADIGWDDKEAVGAGKRGDVSGALPGHEAYLGGQGEVTMGGEEPGYAGFPLPFSRQTRESEAWLGRGIFAESREKRRSKEQESDGRRDGVAGQSEERKRSLTGTGKLAEGDGLAGLDGDAGKEESSACAREGTLDEVKFPGRDTPRDQQQVRR